ncbi:hypothetical protein FGO68_gene12018 [Halteria grandinella]|uniref:Uncharacterized protein n=1 Tax=Halteria grandinella TaxID=5974 RepID=A0A8J8P3A1_HALGN|nr:hypothetical protein FGO68_gene12018 [Halteria grandinella]
MNWMSQCHRNSIEYINKISVESTLALNFRPDLFGRQHICNLLYYIQFDYTQQSRYSKVSYIPQTECIMQSSSLHLRQDLPCSLKLVC